MKTGLILAVLITCISFTSIAQTTFGIRGGVNFQNLNGKDEDGSKLSNKLKTGVNIGVTADIPVAAPDYFVQSGLLFTSKGAKIERPDIKVNVNYFDAGGNLLFGYQFTQNFSAQLNAQLGLVNIGQNSEDEATVKNTGFGVSLGYHFSKP